MNSLSSNAETHSAYWLGLCINRVNKDWKGLKVWKSKLSVGMFKMVLGFHDESPSVDLSFSHIDYAHSS
jgi:hypothetical protein